MPNHSFWSPCYSSQSWFASREGNWTWLAPARAWRFRSLGWRWKALGKLHTPSSCSSQTSSIRLKSVCTKGQRLSSWPSWCCGGGWSGSQWRLKALNYRAFVIQIAGRLAPEETWRGRTNGYTIRAACRLGWHGASSHCSAVGYFAQVPRHRH